ncbi:MAG TPA: hypothetical protein VK599_09435 [Streptosporangiaceae bacterium]|nr:hypothetical protein [Streptosporangiaceae bacterium]
MTTSADARIAVLTSWASTRDRTARTAPARNGLDEKFLREARERLGPEATDGEVRDSADAGRRLHFAKLARARWHPAT